MARRHTSGRHAMRTPPASRWCIRSSASRPITVAENVFLGNQPTNALGLVQWRRMAREAGEQLARFGIDVDPLSRLGDLPIGLQQLIEIARVLFSGARIIIL